jgi:hypothetical protein
MGSLTKARPSVQIPKQTDGRTAKSVDKRGRLVAWALVHRVPVDADVGQDDLARVCAWFGLKVADWETLGRSAPHLAQGVESKRARRRAWATEHGSVPNGWTPPDPSRPKTEQPVERRNGRKTRRYFRAHNQQMHELIRRVWRFREK